jgi:CRISPR-associated endonuclease Csn1
MGEETLGQYFNSLLPPENVSYKKERERIRNRFVNREMYIEEAHIIWNKQTTFHSELNEELRNELIGNPEVNSVTKGAVFFQKPLRSQKHKVGKCTFEPNKSRCAISNLVYQDLLAYKWINTIKKDGGCLSYEESEKIYRFFMANSRFKFREIKQLLDARNSQFNKKNNDVIYGSRLNSRLSDEDIFGMDWFDLPFSKRKDIWHALYFFSNSDRLQTHAQQKWGLGNVAAEKIAKVEVDKRYAPISEKAAKNILYFLQRGVSYQLSVVLGGVKNSLSSVWDNIEETDIQFIINKVVSLYRQNVRNGFLPKLKEFLLDEMQFSDFQIKKLYGLQVQNSDFTIHKKFPFGAKEDKEINDFKNPLLKNTLFQARKIINSVIDKYGVIDEIKVELNTNLKTNKFQRFIYRLDKKRVAKNRSRYFSRIGSLSENLTELNLLKMELWEECSGICPYSGEPIPMDTLFTDNIKVVYIHPWSKSLKDNSLNKTLCYSYFAEKLDEKSPHDFFSDDPEQWEKVVDRAADLFSIVSIIPPTRKNSESLSKDTTEEITSRINWMIPILYAGKSHVF